jgi:hypothetical protein
MRWLVAFFSGAPRSLESGALAARRPEGEKALGRHAKPIDGKSFAGGQILGGNGGVLSENLRVTRFWTGSPGGQGKRQSADAGTPASGWNLSLTFGAPIAEGGPPCGHFRGWRFF